jgi:hypothetical protein
LQVAVPATVRVVQKGTNRFKVRLLRENFDGPVQVAAKGELDGITVGRATMRDRQDLADVEVSATEFAKAGPRELRFTASGAGVTAEEKALTVEVEGLPDKIQVSAPKEIGVPQAQVNSLIVKISRDHFAGPVTVRCTGDTDGVDCPSVTIKPGETQVKLTFAADDQAEPTTRDLTVVAVGGTSRAEAPLSLTVQASLLVKAASSWTWFGVGQAAVWLALVALGLSGLLTSWQARSLGRSMLAGRVWLAAVGGGLVGAIAGGASSVLVGELAARFGAGQWWAYVAFATAWMVMGLLLGRGVAFFIPNLKGWKAAAAGAAGGLVGSLAFLSAQTLGPTSSRFAGAAILGLCIGAMVALVEVLFRRYWLEVKFGEGEIRRVTLGDSPVSIGSDSRSCTIWSASAPPVALTYALESGRLTVTDGITGRKDDIRPGDVRKSGKIEITARGASTESEAPPPPPAIPRPEPLPRPVPEIPRAAHAAPPVAPQYDPRPAAATPPAPVHPGPTPPLSPPLGQPRSTGAYTPPPSQPRPTSAAPAPVGHPAAPAAAARDTRPAPEAMDPRPAPVPAPPSPAPKSVPQSPAVAPPSTTAKAVDVCPKGHAVPKGSRFCMVCGEDF